MCYFNSPRTSTGTWIGAVLGCRVWTCSAAAQQSRFANVSKDSGLQIAANTSVGGTNPHAVAVEDFDGDGLPDVIILTFGKPHVRYFRNAGGLRFKDVTRGSGL